VIQLKALRLGRQWVERQECFAAVMREGNSLSINSRCSHNKTAAGLVRLISMVFRYM
jgi:hypothetical protein